MSNPQAVVDPQIVVVDPQRENNFFKSLEITQDKAQRLRSLTRDIVELEAARGRNILDLGRKLAEIKNDLEPNMWELWCVTFTYTKDYALRMIQISDMVDSGELAGMNLSLQHLREIARLSDDPKKGNFSHLRQVVGELATKYDLSSQQVRLLVGETKKGLNLDTLITEYPDLRTELDRRVKAAHTQGTQEGAVATAALQKELETAKKTLEINQAHIAKLSVKIREVEGAKTIGDGNLDLGKLRVELEQAQQEKTNLILRVNEVQGDLQRQQGEHDRWMNSPLGQAKMDMRKMLDDTTKFFKDTMTPMMIQMKISSSALKPLGSAPKEEVLKMVGVVEAWCKDVKKSLEV